MEKYIPGLEIGHEGTDTCVPTSDFDAKIKDNTLGFMAERLAVQLRKEEILIEYDTTWSNEDEEIDYDLEDQCSGFVDWDDWDEYDKKTECHDDSNPYCIVEFETKPGYATYVMSRIVEKLKTVRLGMKNVEMEFEFDGADESVIRWIYRVNPPLSAHKSQ